MCFSPAASFIASGVIGAAGVATLKKKRTKSELLFASIPLLFAIQQFTEGIVWISFNSPTINLIASYIYVIFAHVFWPIFTPLSLYFLEPRESRKSLLFGFLAIGTIVGMYFLSFIFKSPIVPQIIENSILYNIHTRIYLDVPGAIYLLAICVSPLFSTEKMIKLGGVAIFILFLAAVKIHEETFASIWCFFAALLSIMIYVYFHLKYKNQRGETSKSPA